MPLISNDQHIEQLDGQFQWLGRRLARSPCHIFAFSRVRKLGGTQTRPLTNEEGTATEQVRADREFFERAIRWAEAGIALTDARAGYKSELVQATIGDVSQEQPDDDDPIDF